MNSEIVNILLTCIENICDNPMSKNPLDIGFDHSVWSDKKKIQKGLEEFSEILDYCKEIRRELNL